MTKLLLIFCGLFFITTAHAQRHVQLQSPDKKLTCTIVAGNNGTKYQVSYNKKVLINNSALTLKFDDGFTLNNTIALKPAFKDSVEIYELFTGRSKHVESHYKEVIIPLQDNS